MRNASHKNASIAGVNTVHDAQIKFKFLLVNLLDCTWTENKSYASVQTRKGEPDFTSGSELCIISTKA